MSCKIERQSIDHFKNFLASDSFINLSTRVFINVLPNSWSRYIKMNNELLYENLCEDSCINITFRICAIHSQLSCACSYDLDIKGFITTKNPLWSAMWLMTRYHLTWRKIFTPFISVFDRYRKALDWAQMLKQKECVDIHIVIINICLMPQERLWNAHQIVINLKFSNDRVRFHEHEYFFYEFIERERIFAILSAKGPRISTSMHMSTLTLSQSCFEVIGSQNLNILKNYLRKEIHRRCDNSDEVSLQQAMRALCIV